MTDRKSFTVIWLNQEPLDVDAAHVWLENPLDGGEILQATARAIAAEAATGVTAEELMDGAERGDWEWSLIYPGHLTVA